MNRLWVEGCSKSWGCWQETFHAEEGGGKSAHSEVHHVYGGGYVWGSRGSFL